MIITSVFNKTLKNLSHNPDFYSIDIRSYDNDVFKTALELFPDDPKYRDNFISSVNKSFIDALYKRFKRGGYKYLVTIVSLNKKIYYALFDSLPVNQFSLEVVPPCSLF